MNIDLKLIDELTERLNSEIDDFTVQLDQAKTELSIVVTESKELNLKYEDEQKIVDSYLGKRQDSHASFSPYVTDSETHEISELKQREMDTLKLQLELLDCKVAAKQIECERIEEKIQINVDFLTYLQGIRSNIKKQVDEYNNEYFVLQLKEIVQKKRLISLDKTKYAPVISKIEGQILQSSRETADQLKLALNFIQTDPVRAKQEMDKADSQMKTVIAKTEKLIQKYTKQEPDCALCDSLNSYIGDLVQIYPDIKFRMTVANLEPVNHINIDLNRCLMGLFRGLINSFILKCNPMMIYLRFAYTDGYLNITGKVIGNYINFYNEMKNSPTSMIANIYEKVFLLNGNIVFKNNKDGTFNVRLLIPIKNYLA